jgi:hypothetical protein
MINQLENFYSFVQPYALLPVHTTPGILWKWSDAIASNSLRTRDI